MRMLPAGQGASIWQSEWPCYSRRGPTIPEISAVIAKDLHSGVE
jgi:hypothetical protein